MKKSDETFEAIAKWVEKNGYMQVCGATQQKLLAHFNIDDKTLTRWLNKEPKFAELIKKAQKTFASSTIGEAENVLLNLAFGKAQHKKIKRVKESDAKGNPVIIQQVEFIEELPPNTGALIFLLCNLAPDKWQQKQFRDVTTGGKMINFVGMTPEDFKNLDKLRELGERKNL